MIKIEIWSDINCPFCYIGKRHFEQALEKFPRRDEVVVEWKSFELDQNANPPKGVDNADLLAQKYGKDRKWALQMNDNLTQMASQAGLQFRMNQVIPANSFKAHRLIHLAKSFKLQDQMKEALLKAKFIDGIDIDDQESLIQLGLLVGVPKTNLDTFFEGQQFSTDVRADEAHATQLGISGVPFFVFNSKLALSGAQPVAVFEEVLGKL